MKKLKAYIAPDIVLRLFINKEHREDVVEMLNRKDVEIVTSLFCVYEALACMEEKEITIDVIDMIIFLLQKSAFVQKEIEADLKTQWNMKPERKAQLRKKALQ